MRKRFKQARITALCTAAMCLCAALCSCCAEAGEKALSGGHTESGAPTEDAPKSEAADTARDRDEKENDMITITVNGKSFEAELTDSEAAREFTKLLPLEVDMSELHGNEKYYYLDSPLTSSEQSIGKIRSGDLMLYGSDCVVLFYKDFSTVYSYTPLGRVTDDEGLAQALGSGGVSVLFSKRD